MFESIRPFPDNQRGFLLELWYQKNSLALYSLSWKWRNACLFSVGQVAERNANA